MTKPSRGWTSKTWVNGEPCWLQDLLQNVLNIIVSVNYFLWMKTQHTQERRKNTRWNLLPPKNCTSQQFLPCKDYWTVANRLFTCGDIWWLVKSVSSELLPHSAYVECIIVSLPNKCSLSLSQLLFRCLCEDP